MRGCALLRGLLPHGISFGMDIVFSDTECSFRMQCISKDDPETGKRTVAGVHWVRLCASQIAM